MRANDVPAPRAARLEQTGVPPSQQGGATSRRYEAGDEPRIRCRQAVVRSVLRETLAILPVLPRPHAAVRRSGPSPRPPAARESNASLPLAPRDLLSAARR